MSSSTITGQIRKIALQILDNNPQGVRYSELSRKILEQGNFNKNLIVPNSKRQCFIPMINHPFSDKPYILPIEFIKPEFYK